MMKLARVLIVFFILLLFVPANRLSAANSGEMRVYLNKQEFNPGIPPQFLDGQLMVPMRPFLEVFGADVGWDSETNEVTVRWEGKTIVLGANHALKDGKEPADVSLQVYKGVTMIPIDFVSDFLGLGVQWDQEKGTVRVESPGFISLKRFSNKDSLPGWLEDWVDGARDQLGVQFRIKDNRLYLLGTFGEKATGGYSVRISRITRQADAFVAEIYYTSPTTSRSTIQVITRPYDLIWFDLDVLDGPCPAALIYKIRGLGDTRELPIRAEL